MKIQYKVLGLFLSIASCIGFVAAQNLGSLIDNLGSEIAFGYSQDSNVEITAFSGNTVTIQSPLLKDQSGNTITSYSVMYSQHTLSEILAKTTLLNDAKEVPFNITTDTDPFTMDITIDNPSTSAKYYFFVIPKDSKQALGELSNEVWVNFSNQSFGSDTNELTDTSNHSSATADMSLMHISHTLNQSEITLTWSDINISKTVDIDVMKPGSSLFEDKVTVNMSDEKYVYNATQSGSYTFRFHAIDCDKQINYTVSNVQGSSTSTPAPTTGKVTKVPKTGATENILVILLVAGALYLGYTKIFKKSK